MKRVALFLALTLIALLLTGCSSSVLYSADRTAEIQGLTCYLSRQKNGVFAGGYVWDGTGTKIVIDVPDEVHGRKLDTLGGFLGRGVPCPFSLVFPESYRGYTSNPYVTAAEEEIELQVTVRIGPNVKKINAVDFTSGASYSSVFHSVHIYTTVSVECDEDNPTFYAKDGRLYYRADDTPVKGFS